MSEPSWWGAVEAAPDQEARDELVTRIWEHGTPPLRQPLEYYPSGFQLTPKQDAFCRLTCLEAFFGGAAGGGKSIALLAAALQYADVPGYSAILVRKSYAQLSKPGALMARAEQWLRPTRARWNGQDHQWRFPSGAVLQFGHVEHKGAETQYQSAEFHYLGIDEVTDLTETEYDELTARVRRPVSSDYLGRAADGVSIAEVPLRRRSASNPGGKGHAWVKRRLRDAETRTGVFIASRIDDNPNLDRASYRETLGGMKPTRRAQLMEGDWDARPEGVVFREEWIKILPTLPGDCRTMVRYWDCAATTDEEASDPDYTTGLLLGLRPSGDFVILDLRRGRWTPYEVRQVQEATAHSDGRAVKIGEEQEPGSAGKSLIDVKRRGIFQGYSYKGYPQSVSKLTRAEPVASAAEGGLLYMVGGYRWNNDVREELPAFTGDHDSHDDIVDSLSGAHAMLTGVSAAGSTVASPAGLRIAR